LNVLNQEMVFFRSPRSFLYSILITTRSPSHLLSCQTTKPIKLSQLYDSTTKRFHLSMRKKKFIWWDWTSGVLMLETSKALFLFMLHRVSIYFN
jgi:hypothetical protein